MDATEKPTWSDHAGVQTPAAEDGKSVTLTWNGASDNTGVSGYTVYKEGDKVGTDYTTSKQTNFTVPGLTPAKEYTFKGEAADATGNRTSDGPEVKVTTKGKADVTAPTLPSNTEIKEPTTTIPASDTFSGKKVEVVYPGFTWASVGWDAANDDTGIGGYNVYENGQSIQPTGASFTPINAEMTTAKTNYTVTGLKQGKTYIFKVEAVGRGMKFSKRERLSDVYPNGLVPVAGYRWSGFGPSETVHLIPGKAVSEAAKSK